MNYPNFEEFVRRAKQKNYNKYKKIGFNDKLRSEKMFYFDHNYMKFIKFNFVVDVVNCINLDQHYLFMLKINMMEKNQKVHI